MNKMTQISAKVVADSKNEFGNRLTTMVVTFPRIILAEFNTHRMFSRNSASSRAIPFKKMLISVIDNPFIPIAFQKDHSGMQGTEYFSQDEKFSVGNDLFLILSNVFKYKEDELVDEEFFKILQLVLKKYSHLSLTLKEWWLLCRDSAIESACLMAMLGITKQICNRLLEPFMWHTVIVSATEWENFFALRCPQYQRPYYMGANINTREPSGYTTLRSRKDYLSGCTKEYIENEAPKTQLDWLKNNKGQAEIHMMALAEAMWDAYNESTPKELKAGEWHIPFNEKWMVEGGYPKDLFNIEEQIKIGTVRAARTSYTVVGEDEKFMTIGNIFKLHDKLVTANPLHASPMEHCARAMNNTERHSNINGKVSYYNPNNDPLAGHFDKHELHDPEEQSFGWSGNFRGFIQYRKMLPNENITL